VIFTRPKLRCTLKNNCWVAFVGGPQLFRSSIFPSFSEEDNRAKAQETVSDRDNFNADEDKEEREEAAESSTRPDNAEAKEKEKESAEIRAPTPIADEATKETERPAPQKEPLSTVRKGTII
jgi:hypothetical protein